MKINPNERFTIDQIKKHPWFNLVNPKYNISKGLDIDTLIMPIDEDLINQMEELGYSKDDVRANLLANKHNHFTTTYYLLLNMKKQKGLSSVSDLSSKLFYEYSINPDNYLEKFNFNLKDIIKKRAYSKRDKAATANISSDKKISEDSIFTTNNNKNVDKSLKRKLYLSLTFILIGFMVAFAASMFL